MTWSKTQRIEAERATGYAWSWVSELVARFGDRTRDVGLPRVVEIVRAHEAARLPTIRDEAASLGVSTRSLYQGAKLRGISVRDEIARRRNPPRVVRTVADDYREWGITRAEYREAARRVRGEVMR